MTIPCLLFVVFFFFPMTHNLKELQQKRRDLHYGNATEKRRRTASCVFQGSARCWLNVLDTVTPYIYAMQHILCETQGLQKTGIALALPWHPCVDNLQDVRTYMAPLHKTAKLSVCAREHGPYGCEWSVAKCLIDLLTISYSLYWIIQLILIIK